MSAATIAAPSTHGPTALGEYTTSAGPSLPREVVETYTAEIQSCLGVGDVDAAYGCFTEWIRREARYAQAGRSANLGDLMNQMLELLGWMRDRVPRGMSQIAAMN